LSDRAAAPTAARIEEAGLNAVQTQRQVFYDGWVVRLSPGKAKRGRSVNAHFGSTLPLDAKIDHCERLYASRGLPTLFRITPVQHPSTLEAALDARGYVAFDWTFVQLMPLVRPPDVARRDGDADIVLSTPAIPAFVDAVGTMRGSPAGQRDAHLERLANTPLPMLALLATLDGVTVGAGQVALDGSLAGVFDVVTGEAARGRGIATRIVERLLAWAWEHGATHAYLQVESGNAPALRIYQRFGFVTAYEYHYRGRPGACE
jgi:GNAT superfamily N-acetyltransferase